MRRLTIEFDVPARMRDGVTLRANVYRPAGDGPWPTLLLRTPYDKHEQHADALVAARNGFLVAVQDTRGRFASEGEWAPFRCERPDGYDAVEWAAGLAGANGRVGMFGRSYVGNAQWMAAAARPPSLAAIAPMVTFSEPLDGVFRRGGAVELGLALPWTLATGASHLRRIGADADGLAALVDDYDRLATDGYWQLPVADTDVLRRHDVPDIGAMRMPDDDTVAAWCRVAGRHHEVTVPTFGIGGWYDVFLQGTLDNHAAMAALGRSTRLLVGPWRHGQLADPIGALCFGMRSAFRGAPGDGVHSSEQLMFAWLRDRLADDPVTPELAERPVRIFVMGRNEWRDEPAWPLARARVEPWYLGRGGTLHPEPGGPHDPPTEFSYDPADPVPTVGGHTLMSPAFPSGPLDQAPVERRRDVCVFTSEPLRRDLEVTGRVRVVLHAASSARSTDWVARLCDVHPDGRSFNLCDGILRIADGADSCRRVEIDLWSTSNVFLAGHRLRVHVTSSSFPRWDRNLNTGRQREARWLRARQRVFHDARRPSRIELPVVD